MKKSLITSFLLFVISFANTQTLPSKIAFGSCGHQNHPLPVFDVVVKHQPDYFIFLGDNIYGDTWSMNTLRKKYNMLGSKPTFQNLKKNTKILATWDDHDYGQNDSGKEYPFKKKSKNIFLDFFEEPVNSDRRKHNGIYTSYMFESNGKKLQIILLDVRTFRDRLKFASSAANKKHGAFYKIDYLPHTDTTKTLLGKEQWQWLENELKKPADLRIIGSGSQFGIEFNGYEAWANFPHEQKKFFELIKETKANGVLFITGDVHYAELSKQQPNGLYPIYDITASGLSSTWGFSTPNKFRTKGPVMENHFGLITINWEDKKLKMEILDVDNKQRLEHEISFSELQLP